MQWVARLGHVVYDARRAGSGWKLPGGSNQSRKSASIPGFEAEALHGRSLEILSHSPFAMTHVIASESPGCEKGRFERFFCFSVFALPSRWSAGFSPSVEWGVLRGRSRSSPVLMLPYIEAVPDASPRVQGFFLPCTAVLRFRPINPPFFSRVTS